MTAGFTTAKDIETVGAAPSSVVVRSADKPPRRFRRYLALDDFEDGARQLLPRFVFGYISGSAERGQAFRASGNAFLDYAFRPRVLVDTAQRSQATTLFGRTYQAPFGIAPMGASVLAAYDGDVILARAAAGAGIPFIQSASSLTALERVAGAGGAPWFQAYLPGDPARILPMIDRVAAAGFETLVLTVDLPVLGNREHNIRVGFSMPVQPSLRLACDCVTHPRWLARWGSMVLRHGMPHFENMEAGRGPPVLSRALERNVRDRDRLSWEHVRLMRQRWKGRLILKGIVRPDDAVLAREHGIDGVIVSNHGGRQLDGTIAPLRVLPDIAEVAGDMAVMLDSGIRRGTDVLKALALGADFVFIGRPFLYAAAVGGEAGVTHAIALLSSEIHRNLALLGILSPAEMNPDLVMRHPSTISST